MKQLMTHDTLRRENLAFVGTGGVSEGNRHQGFQPAFYDTATGRAELARFADGRPAPMHLLDGLPDEWIAERAPCGRARAVKSTVISGFIHGPYFYTRAQAARAIHH